MTLQTQKISSYLDAYPFGQIRRNHGLEHATLHVLAQRHPRLAAAGHSDAGGFWIIANISAEEMRSAVEEALQRLRSGESQLAVHPNCGTNIVTAGIMAGLAGALTMFGVGRRSRDKLERLPLAISLATLALIASQPVGMFLQSRLTTSGDPASLELIEIRTSQRGRVETHRIVTRDIA
jgi:hypothetical protein